MKLILPLHKEVTIVTLNLQVGISFSVQRDSKLISARVIDYSYETHTAASQRGYNTNPKPPSRNQLQRPERVNTSWNLRRE
jgi:hypothetical protein